MIGESDHVGNLRLRVVTILQITLREALPCGLENVAVTGSFGSELTLQGTPASEKAACDRNNSKRYSLSEAVHGDVSDCLYRAFTAEDGVLSNLDHWTQHRVALENLAKVDLALAADDAVKYCHQNLIREIDSEAEYGIYIAGQECAEAQLQRLIEEPGVSGELGGELAAIAPKLFPDELAHSDSEMDLVWITIRARYGRARIDAEVSEITMAFLMDDARVAADMCNALRSMMYSLHEDTTRRSCNLEPVLRERGSRETALMASELRNCAGSYFARIDEIARRAGTR